MAFSLKVAQIVSKSTTFFSQCNEKCEEIVPQDAHFLLFAIKARPEAGGRKRRMCQRIS
jgi:hypothetical protein